MSTPLSSRLSHELIISQQLLSVDPIYELYDEDGIEKLPTRAFILDLVWEHKMVVLREIILL